MSTIFGAKKYYFLHRFTLDKTRDILYNSQAVADLAHLVERHLAKVEVASSSLVIRSILNTVKHRFIPGALFFCSRTTAHKNNAVSCLQDPISECFLRHDDKTTNHNAQKTLNQAGAKGGLKIRKSRPVKSLLPCDGAENARNTSSLFRHFALPQEQYPFLQGTWQF